MWSGGRSQRFIAVAGGLTGLLGTAAGQSPLCNGQHPGNPELISGAASCIYNEVGGVGQTLIDLSDTSVIRWDHLGLGNSSSSLTFRWSGNPAGNATVINRVESGNAGRGGSLHSVAGTLEFLDGNLVITNPNSEVTISGTVAARSLIFATHRLDPVMEQQLLSGQSADFTGSARPLNVIDGRVVATQGEVVLAGRQVLNSAMGNPGDGTDAISAPNGSVRIFGGQNFRLLPDGPERLQALPGTGGGSVVSSQTIRAGQSVEISAIKGIENAGLIEAKGGTGQIFLRVDDGMGGLITNAGVIAGAVRSSPQVDGPGILLQPDDADSPSGLSTGISRFPAVYRPGETPTSRRVVVFENAPTTGSASAQRERTVRGSNEARSSSPGAGNTRGSGGGKEPLARGRSFFGLRGASAAQKEAP